MTTTAVRCDVTGDQLLVIMRAGFLPHVSVYSLKGRCFLTEFPFLFVGLSEIERIKSTEFSWLQPVWTSN